MKTIYSTKEYKFLDSRIKTYLPKYELAVFYMSVTSSIQLMAAPRYTGYQTHIIDPEFSIKEPIYTFNTGKFLDCHYPDDVDQRLYWFCQGLHMGGRNALIYFHNNPLFKNGIGIFEELFKTAVAKHHSADLSEIRLHSYGLKKPDESPFITKKDLFICYTNSMYKNFSYDEFYINADMNYAR